MAPVDSRRMPIHILYPIFLKNPFRAWMSASVSMPLDLTPSTTPRMPRRYWRAAKLWAASGDGLGCADALRNLGPEALEIADIPRV